MQVVCEIQGFIKHVSLDSPAFLWWQEKHILIMQLFGKAYVLKQLLVDIINLVSP